MKRRLETLEKALEGNPTLTFCFCGYEWPWSADTPEEAVTMVNSANPDTYERFPFDRWVWDGFTIIDTPRFDFRKPKRGDVILTEEGIVTV
jgi:hypothetical protein